MGENYLQAEHALTMDCGYTVKNTGKPLERSRGLSSNSMATSPT